MAAIMANGMSEQRDTIRKRHGRKCVYQVEVPVLLLVLVDGGWCAGFSRGVPSSCSYALGGRV